MTGLVSQSAILVKAETTYNTDAAPVPGTDAVLVQNLKHDYSKQRMFGRPALKPTFGPMRPLYAGSLYEVSFEVEDKGSGTAGTPPEVGVCLLGAAFSETIVAVTSATYKPTSTIANHKSLTIWLYEAGHVYKITGARASKCAYSRKVGEAGKWSFTFIGHILVAPADGALIAPTFDSTVPPMSLGLTATIDSYAAVITKVEFDMGLEIATPESISAVDGYGEIQIVGRNITGALDPHRAAISAYDFQAKWKSGGPYAFASGVIGATAGNRISITMPAVQPMAIGMSEAGKIATFDYKFTAVESTTDDQVSVAYT